MHGQQRVYFMGQKYGGPGGHFHHSSLHLCHSSLHLCHSTSTTPHSTSVTLLPAIPGSTHVTPRPQSIRRGVGGATSIASFEHASFTPLVLSACGGLATGASTFYKRLASLLAEKWEQPCSITISWLRCTLSFSLLRSAI